MTHEGYRVKTIEQFVGRELGVSEWVMIEPERINQFAACTDDHQWIHEDIGRAKRESPFGATIAHGYLTFSLLARFGFEVGRFPPDAASAVNCGLDRVRFLAPGFIPTITA